MRAGGPHTDLDTLTLLLHRPGQVPPRLVPAWSDSAIGSAISTVMGQYLILAKKGWVFNSFRNATLHSRAERYMLSIRLCLGRGAMRKAIADKVVDHLLKTQPAL